jgi:hypothetical protein
MRRCPPLQRLAYAMPDYNAGLCLAAACLVALNRVQEAQDIAAKVLDVEPSFSISDLAHSAPYRHAALREQFMSRLAEAGLPRDPALKCASVMFAVRLRCGIGPASFGSASHSARDQADEDD